MRQNLNGGFGIKPSFRTVYVMNFSGRKDDVIGAL
jgi:hypothetical protein